MTSTVSGQYGFTLDVDEVVDEAFEKLGGEHTSGISAYQARRTLNLVLIELQNKGIPINTLDFIKVDMDGSGEYILDEKHEAVYTVNLKREDIETPMLRYSLQEFHQIPTKDQKGRPTTYTVERNTNNLKIKVWPLSDKSSDDLEIMTYTKIDDVNAAYQKINLSQRYMPAVVYGLAYHLSLHRQGVDGTIVKSLKELYEQLLNEAAEEDRERVSTRIKPEISGWR